MSEENVYGEFDMFAHYVTEDECVEASQVVEYLDKLDILEKIIEKIMSR
jgi:hypothetical protein